MNHSPKKNISELITGPASTQEISNSLLSSPFLTSTPHDLEKSFGKTASQRSDESMSSEPISQEKSNTNIISTPLCNRFDQLNKSQTNNRILNLRPGNSQIKSNSEKLRSNSKTQNTAERNKALLLGIWNKTECNKTNTGNEQIFKRKQSEAFFDNNNLQNQTKKICQVNTNSFCRLNSNSPGPSSDTSNKSRKDFLLNIFDVGKKTNELEAPKSKKTVCFAPEIQEEEIIQKRVKGKIGKISREKKAVTRTFPGPAGIFLNNSEESEVNNMNLFDENTSAKKENKINNFCSQNTKNLFTSGAWKLMMDDLPGSVELLDIEFVKKNAFLYKKKGSKIPYLAAVISQIDYRQIDAHVVLKDISDDITGQIHHSVIKQYSNVLGCGLVILLKDAAVVVTSKKHVCILISSKSLVGIYSDEERLVETPLLKKIQDEDVEPEIGEDLENL